jgi:hypothetical protein
MAGIPLLADEFVQAEVRTRETEQKGGRISHQCNAYIENSGIHGDSRLISEIKKPSPNQEESSA